MQSVLDHLVLNISDDEKMISFYTEILQFGAERLAEYRRGEVPFPSVRLNSETIIDLFPKRMWEQDSGASRGWSNLNHFCICVTKASWDNLKTRLDAGGISIEQGPIPRWGAHGTGISIYFRDPEENLIEARYYEKRSDHEPCLLGS